MLLEQQQVDMGVLLEEAMKGRIWLQQFIRYDRKYND